MDQSLCDELHDSQSMDHLSGTAVEKSYAVNQVTALPNTERGSQIKALLEGRS